MLGLPLLLDGNDLTHRLDVPLPQVPVVLQRDVPRLLELQRQVVAQVLALRPPVRLRPLCLFGWKFVILVNSRSVFEKFKAHTTKYVNNKYYYRIN